MFCLGGIMLENKKKFCVVFAGGGTGGHIYPGIAVADELQSLAKSHNVEIEIHWIGSSSGMDRSIVEKNLVSCGGSITAFHDIACGKLRRYFSFRNFTDLFKIFFGFVSSYFLLKKLKPNCLFSKGGFVSVTPCRACKLLKIPYFTHECDFTPGLATRLNSGGAKKILVSYEETSGYFKESLRSKICVTGNPVRPVFYEDNSSAGREFLGIPETNSRPILLVLGGSLGALQINNLVVENLDYLKKNFIVIHQTGKKFADENPKIMESGDEFYKPYAFIYSQMPSVIQAADIVLSRSGANSLWECAVTSKPMILVPLCSNGSRGDQVDNAKYFKDKNAAFMLVGEDATSDKLIECLESLKDKTKREQFSDSLKIICGKEKPVSRIAGIVLEEIQ